MGKRIGEVQCLNRRCSCADATVEETSAGTWQVKCHKCQISSYAKRGTRAFRDLEAEIRRDESDEPKPAPKAPAKAEPPAPAPAPNPPRPARPPMSAFNLADL